MQRYEYKVVPAPRKGIKTRSARTTEDRFAAALEEVMNVQGAQGWEYVRSDTLPAEERQGLTGRTTVYQNMLVFRRVLGAESRPVLAAPASAPLAALPAAPVAAEPPPVIAAPEPAVLPLAAGGARDPFSVQVPQAPLVLDQHAGRSAPALGPAAAPRELG